MSMTRWDPYREALTLREAMNRLFEESMVPTSRRREEGEGGVPVALDMYETDEAVMVKSDLPGVKPDDVEITVTENVLTIKGQFETEEEEDRGDVHVRERRYGAFQRSVSLPTEVEATRAEASFEDGVLTVSLPKMEEQKPKRIEVKAT